jgi:PAS domain S-box-containing protein
VLLFEVAFIAAYRFGMPSARGEAAPFGFPWAVLFSVLLLSRPNQWWLYILGTIPIRFFLFVPPDTPLWFVSACFANDSLAVLLSAWLLRQPSRDHAWFDNLHEFRRYFLFGVILAPGLSALTGAVLQTVMGHRFWTTWNTWFFASALGSLVLSPFILLVMNCKRFPFDNLRFGRVGASATLLLMSALSILATRLVRGPFSLQSNEGILVSVEVSLFLASVPFMFLSVIAYQQRRRLKESEESFRAVVDVAPVMLWMSGTDARCTFFNKSWLDFTGLSHKEQVEQDWVVFVHAEDRERCVNKYLSAFRARESFTLDYRLLRNDGVYRWVVHNGVPRYSADGTFLGYIGSRVDFTDRREAEEQLRQVSTQLLNANEIERSHIGNELHEDLAQKLCALSIDVSRFSRECGNGSLACDFDRLEKRLRDVSIEVLSLSQQLRPTTVEGLGLTAALRNLCHQATDRKRAVLFDQHEDLPPLPEHLSLPLYRIAQESLQNALAHSTATYIHVELSATATTVQLSVRDNGCGFVVGSNTKPGLGLSRMSERMKSSGGGFSIISNPGEGTTIVATMPLTQSVRAATA